AALTTVTIPAGATSVKFWVFPEDDGVANFGGQQFPVNILATAQGFKSGTGALTVTDVPGNTIPTSPVSWTSQGPTQVSNGQSTTPTLTPPTNDLVDGTTEKILCDPINNVVYAGTVNGGIWKAGYNAGN